MLPPPVEMSRKKCLNLLIFLDLTTFRERRLNYLKTWKMESCTHRAPGGTICNSLEPTLPTSQRSRQVPDRAAPPAGVLNFWGADGPRRESRGRGV